MKGISVLALHRPFNLAKGIAVDDLHCIFLGVTSDLLHYWFDKTFRRNLVQRAIPALWEIYSAQVNELLVIESKIAIKRVTAELLKFQSLFVPTRFFTIDRAKFRFRSTSEINRDVVFTRVGTLTCLLNMYVPTKWVNSC